MYAQRLPSPVSFDEFVAWLPESSSQRYELHRGVVVEMPKPKGKHSQVAGYVIKTLNHAIDQGRQPWFIPGECLVRTGADTAYEPDAIVLNEPALADEPDWERGSIVALGQSIQVVVEVVSTNWQDDYLHKLADYELMGIPEYWIIDYAALGGRRFIGNPKQPTITICSLVDGEYQLQQFQASDRLISTTFPALQVNATEILQGG